MSIYDKTSEQRAQREQFAALVRERFRVGERVAYLNKVCTIKFVDIWCGVVEARVVVYCDYTNSAGDIATVVLGEEMVASLIAKNALLF